GPRAIGDHGAPVSLPKLKKAYEKGTRFVNAPSSNNLQINDLNICLEYINEDRSRGGLTTHGAPGQ
ncbi:unnamed protein product, partial [Staurois parvus]